MLDTPETAILETLLVLIQLHFLFLPLLIAVYVTSSIALKVYQRNYRAAAVLAVLSFALIYMFFGTPLTFTGYLCITACVAGFLIGYLFQQKYAPQKILILIISFFVISSSLGMLVYEGITHTTLGTHYAGHITPWVRLFLHDLEQQTGAAEDGEQLTANQLKKIEHTNSKILNTLNGFIHYCYPALIIITGITMGVAGFFRSQGALVNAQKQVPGVVAFDRWRCPDILTVAFVVSGCAASANLVWEQAVFLPHLGLNLLLPVLWIYFIQGLSLSTFFTLKWNVPRLLRFIFYFMFAIRPHFQLILSGIGIADTWINFRRFGQENASDDAGTSHKQK